ncbi:MAG: DUF4114 domain-containing protein, partial [Polyangia bacterium]|nr:DUF4114 domain-containing protein [Polyangia bacterium]
MRPSTHLGLLALLCLFAGSEEAYGQTSVCYNHLSRTTYDNGFSLSDFSSSSGVSIVNGALELDTDERQLGDANRISVNTRQKLTAHYVYESAGASHTFGWFIWDNAMDPYVTPSGWNFTTRTCSSAGECDPGMSCVLNGATRYCAYPKYVLRDDGVAADTWAGNAAFDWFEALYVKTCKTCTPLLLTSPYSDASRGGTMNHVPNLLETLVNQRGGWVFLLADDDTDTDAYQNLPPVADVRTTHDGIPDYDVNGDGVINALDRTVELGTFDSGSELVFFLVVYYEQRPRKSSMGMQGTLTCPSPCTSKKRNCTWCKANCSPEQWGSSCDSTNNCRNCRPYYAQNPDEVDAKIIPYFSKRVLNPDFTSSGNGSFQRDIGCAYDPNDPPIKCGGYEGWLDQAALNRLSSLYGLNIPHEVKTINYRMGGQSDHVFIGAPSTEPNWWILGFEDLYDHGDKDFNDLVFLVFRTNGGEVVSNDLVTELTPDQKASSTITKVRFKKRDMIPTPPCSTDPDKVRIEYYISISADQNGSPIWFKIDFPPGSDEAIIDMQDLGAAGAELRWKAAIITDDHLCKPQILDVDVGYEAMKSGEYLFTSPLPLANTLFRAGLETRSPSWTVTASDYSNRGHFRMYELYSPSTPDTMTKTQIWDAGAALAARNPDTRTVFTHQNGTKELLSSAASAWTLSQVLSSSDRAERLNGRLVYDLDGDGDSDDDDARYLIQWTRGWEIPSTQQRAWKLGAINKSTAAVVHVPGDPDWMSKVAIPTTIRTAYRDWVTQPAIAERRTIAYVGSQSGMLHAFDAGEFRWGDNPDTGILENRGYFKYTTGAPTYGNGSEKFAYVPPTLIGDLKNNRVRNYFPETHPQAMVEGSVVVSDLYGVFPFSPAPEVAQWRTAVAFSLGRLRPAISALDVTDPNDPRPLWATDWTDSDFHGTNAAPTLSFVPGST